MLYGSGLAEKSCLSICHSSLFGVFSTVGTALKRPLGKVNGRM